MKKLLLITGDIAAGKSTFSKILSDRYHIAAFQKDSIKEILGDTIEVDAADFSYQTDEKLLGRIDEFMK